MNFAEWRKDKNRIYDGIFFGMLFVIYTAVTFVLFSRQSYGTEMLYHSDMKAYILEMQGLDSGYPFPYPLFFKFAALFHLVIATPEMSVVVALTVLNSLSLIVTKYYADTVLLRELEVQGRWKSLLLRLSVTALVFALFFVSMIYSVTGVQLPGIFRRYRGVFSPNPFHNATYMATRPFAIATFFVFVRVLREYEQKWKWREGLLFGTLLFLSTITKPSFTFILVPAAGLIMLQRLFKAKWKNFRPTLYLGLCFLPTFGALLYQFFGVFGPVEGEETGIGFALGKAWSYHCTNIPLAVALGLAFPIVVLILNIRDLKKDGAFRLAWQITAVSLAEALFFYEKGYRIGDMNFSWGYMHGMFFAFVASAFLLFGKTWNCYKNKSEKEKTTIPGRLLLWGQWTFFVWHLLCGLWYFRSVFIGELYY